VIDVEFDEFDRRFAHASCKARLCQITLVDVDGNDPIGPPALHLDRIEAGVTTHVQDRLASQVGGQSVGEALPFDARIVTEKMVRRGLDPAQSQVVKPFAQRADLRGGVILTLDDGIAEVGPGRRRHVTASRSLSAWRYP
jgi:hypothetical protein